MACFAQSERFRQIIGLVNRKLDFMRLSKGKERVLVARVVRSHKCIVVQLSTILRTPLSTTDLCDHVAIPGDEELEYRECLEPQTSYIVHRVKKCRRRHATGRALP